MTVKPIKGGVMKKLKGISYAYENDELIFERTGKYDLPWWLPKKVGFRLFKHRMHTDADYRKRLADKLLRTYDAIAMSEGMYCNGDTTEKTLTISVQDSYVHMYFTEHTKDTTYRFILMFY